MAKKKLRSPKRRETAKSATSKRQFVPAISKTEFPAVVANVHGAIVQLQKHAVGLQSALRDLLVFYDRGGHDGLGWSTAEVLRLAEIRVLARTGSENK